MNRRIIDGGQPGGGPYRQALSDARGRLGRLGSTVFFYPTVGSTNDIAACLAREWLDNRGGRDPEGAVIIADEQTAGRGRRGHVWISPAASGLYVSVVLTPSRATSDARRANGLLTLAAGVALVEGIEAATGFPPDLKWPNDIYAGGGKLGGILAEGVAAEPGVVSCVVLGYGVNVKAVEWPAELTHRATSLEAAVGRRVDRDRLLIESLAAIARRYDDLLAGRFDAILDAWRRRAPSATGTPVEWTDASGEHAGITTGIDDQGALLVLEKQAIHRLVAGELRWRLSLEP